MDGFVGREQELKMLEDLYKAAPQSCAVYGRMRLGKTAMLQKFCEFKRHIYIAGSDMLPEDCLRTMSEAVSRYADCKVRLDDVQDFFYAIKKYCVKKTVVILDHYSELLEAFPDLYTHVNRFISRDIRSTRVLFIACDTDISVLGSFTNQIEVGPMSYIDCAGFHPDYSPIQHLQAYGMIGGTPEYQRIIKGDPMDAIKGCFLEPMAPLSMESESMVDSEISGRSDSIRVLHAMAAGADSLRSISSISGLSLSTCTRAIGEMENKKLVVREGASMTQRNWTCNFDSNILKFYYTVVAAAKMSPDFYSVDKALAEARGRMPAYMEGTFRSVCMEYVRMRWAAASIEPMSGASDIYTATVVDKGGKKSPAFLAFRLAGDPLSVGDLNKVVARSKAQRPKGRCCYMLFSGCGFEEGLKSSSPPDADLVLLSLDDVYAPIPSAEAEP